MPVDQCFIFEFLKLAHVFILFDAVTDTDTVEAALYESNQRLAELLYIVRFPFVAVFHDLFGAAVYLEEALESSEVGEQFEG